MSDDVVKINRAISGDVAKLSEELTGLDLRMVRDPFPLLTLARLRRVADRRNKKLAVALLELQEKVIRAKQYGDWSRELREDISKLGLAYGNIKPESGIDEDLA